MKAENSVRRLTDDELEIIKEYPGHFEHIYQIIDDRDERVLCIRIYTSKYRDMRGNSGRIRHDRNKKCGPV